MTVFFTSDLHIGHKSVIGFCRRPFKDVDEMADKLMENWNKKVGKDDEVYVLGDVFWHHNPKQIAEYMKKLNGTKYLIYGNHDRKGNNRKSNAWKDIQPYMEISVNGCKVILSHYPLAEWNGCYNASVHLHGHVHGTFDFATLPLPHGNKRIYDVGVDSNDYEPKSFEEIIERLPLYEARPILNN